MRSLTMKGLLLSQNLPLILAGKSLTEVVSWMHASWILWERVRAMAVMWGWLWPWMSLKTAMSSFISSTVGVLMLRMALATIQAPTVELMNELISSTVGVLMLRMALATIQ